MFLEANFDKRVLAHYRGVIVCLLMAAGVSLAVSTANAQYSFNPSNADELGIRYFGSAKDDKGALLPGVAVTINVDENVFVFMTDEQGRFRGRVPLESLGLGSNMTTTTCSKRGYQFVSATKRSGLGGPKPYVQVDCVLHLATSQ